VIEEAGSGGFLSQSTGLSLDNSLPSFLVEVFFL